MMLAEHVSIVYVAGVECGRAMEAASSGDVGSVLHVSGLPLTATEQTVTASVSYTHLTLPTNREV